MDEAPRADKGAPELTVSELTRRVKALIESQPDFGGLWVRGEASNVRLAASGHLYFTLKDDKSQLPVAYFGYSKGRPRKPPKDGDALLVHGAVRVYEPRGAYQLVADDIVQAGVGDLAARFEELKRRLHEEGLFAEERKTAPPRIPRRIAIITSESTAAFQDVLNVLRRRAPYLHAVLLHASVQGEKAPPEIMQALKYADAMPDIETILLVRGGGSIEDLWCFNDEMLARAMAEIERPIITGIGHEIDFTIADFVADRRAPTPSAAAELVAPDATELQNALTQQSRMLAGRLGTELEDKRESLERLFDRRLIRDVLGSVTQYEQSVDDFAIDMADAAAAAVKLGEEAPFARELDTMSHLLLRELETAQRNLPVAEDRMVRSLRSNFADRQSAASAMAKQLKALDPRAPKKLGFSLVWDSEGKIVRSADSVQPGDKLSVELPDGNIDTEAI